MAKTCVNTFLIFYLLCIVFCDAAAGGRHHRPNQAESWCMITAGSPTAKLQGFIDYACGVVDCGPIQPGAPCYNPNSNLYSLASFCLNQIYFEKGFCNAEIGHLIYNNPSHDGCVYPGRFA